MRLGHHYYDSGDLSFHFAVIIVLLWAHGGLFNNLFKKKKKKSIEMRVNLSRNDYRAKATPQLTLSRQNSQLVIHVIVGLHVHHLKNVFSSKDLFIN